jgi:hypothetical protein
MFLDTNYGVHHMPHILEIKDVLPGDVLLCRSENFGGEIADYTKNKYVHAAICVRPNCAAEASGTRVKEVAIDSLFESYDYIAVLHQPDCWSDRRVKELEKFITAAISRKARFNCDGIRNFEERKQAHEENMTKKLNKFFEQAQVDHASERESYFCSELVAAAHVAVKIIQPSAAVFYDPSILSPGELANDFTFGAFAGYLIPYSEYLVPSDDEFASATPCHEIFQAQK